jgi:hypothetical protein
MNAPWERRGVPRPPADIEAEMAAAGAAGDDVRLGLARARYTAWLADHGYTEPPRGTERPDGAIR